MICFSLFISILSCRNNRLKTDEKVLKKELLTLINKEKDPVNNLVSDTSGQIPYRFMYSENRSIDPANPPLVIDIEGCLDKIYEFKLSEVVSEIKYVRIEQPPDSAFIKDIQFDYYLTNDYIIAVTGSIVIEPFNAIYSCHRSRHDWQPGNRL